MKLVIDELGLSHDIAEGTILTLGRTGRGADIEIDDQRISKRHVDIQLMDGQLRIFDPSSTNGIFINGTRMQPETWYTLSKEDQVTIPGCRLKFSDLERVLEAKTETHPNQKKEEDTPQPIADETEKKIPHQPAGNFYSSANSAEKFEQNNKGDSKEFDLNKRFKELLALKLPIKIGRLDSNDIVLPDQVSTDKLVSRHHAEISYKEGNFWLQDLGSTNGTYLNDEKLSPSQPRIIERKDVILIHLHYFSLEEGYRDLRKEVAIRAEGIGKKYPNGFVGLNPMSVEIPYKQIVALMGPSGCGKSTLLKALNGDSPATSGNVFIHGLSLRENYSLLKRKIGYVPQDDTIHKELSVEETLFLAAKLRLADDTSLDEINLRITEVLSSLNCDDDVRKKKVGGLSGGQRKRVCIAVELLSRPTILFLDEPTSPLDPETIEEFLISLRKLAQNGTTIVMVTHKPEDLNYADQVIFMAAKGYFVYHGEREGLTKKFGVDHLIKVYTVCGDKEKEKDSAKNKARQDAFVEKYYIKPKGHIIAREPVNEVSADKQNSLILQFYWLATRYLHIKINDRQNLILLLAQPFIIAALICLIFHGVNISVMMLIAISAIWFGVSNSSKEIVAEFAVYKRERMFNLDIHTYILSKWAVLSLIALVQVIIFIGIIHLRFGNEGVKVLGSYIPNVLYMFYIASSATLFGLFLSAFYNTTEKVLTVVPIALMPQIMLAGVVEKISSVKIDVLSYLTLGRWGTEGLARLQKTETMDLSLNALYYGENLQNNGKTVVTLFDSIFANIFIMLIISIGMYVLTYISLKKKDTI